MTSLMTSAQLTVIFDGMCGFCTRTVRLLRARDPDSRITWVPCQRLASDDTLRRPCEAAVIAITETGEHSTGAQAFARILTTLTGSYWPVRIAALPVAQTLLSLGYRLIALLRSRLPGDDPWCNQYPDDCLPSQ